MKNLLLIFIILLLNGCGYKPPNYTEITNNFLKNKSSFLELKKMIVLDTKNNECMTVSKSNIGDYWEHDNLWNSNQDYNKKIHLSEVLKIYNISKDRYNRYMNLLTKVGGIGISYCKGERDWTRIIIGTTGLGISGCLTSINYINNIKYIPKTVKKPGWSEIIVPINDNWYIEESCT